jgi:hypothetical protein
MSTCSAPISMADPAGFAGAVWLVAQGGEIMFRG